MDDLEQLQEILREDPAPTPTPRHIRKGGGSKCKISGNMSLRHWADTRVRPYRRIMYAEYDRRVMYAEYDRRIMYAEYDRRIIYAEYDRRDMYVYEISHLSPLKN